MVDMVTIGLNYTVKAQAPKCQMYRIQQNHISLWLIKQLPTNLGKIGENQNGVKSFAKTNQENNKAR